MARRCDPAEVSSARERAPREGSKVHLARDEARMPLGYGRSHMIYLPVSLFLFLLFLLLFPFIWIAVALDVVEIAVAKLGFSPGVAF